MRTRIAGGFLTSHALRAQPGSSRKEEKMPDRIFFLYEQSSFMEKSD